VAEAGKMSESERSFKSRAAAIFRLKDFAVKKGYDVPERLLEAINKLSTEGEPSPANEVAADRLTIELADITYPVTTANIGAVEARGVTRFVYLLLGLGVVAAVGAGVCAWIIKHAPTNESVNPFIPGILPPLLGVVGAVIYVLLPNGRLNVVAGIDQESIANDLVRVGLGALLGFVLSLVGAAVSPSSGGAAIDWTLLLPLLGGYSITLVVGILAKLVAAAQLAFNIDEKSVRASLRK
jgi:hypothetical protein